MFGPRQTVPCLSNFGEAPHALSPGRRRLVVPGLTRRRKPCKNPAKQHVYAESCTIVVELRRRGCLGRMQDRLLELVPRVVIGFMQRKQLPCYGHPLSCQKQGKETRNVRPEMKSEGQSISTPLVLAFV